MGSFDKRGIGDFISRMTNDIEMIFNAMNNGFSNLVGGLLSMITVLVAMFVLSVPLTFVVLAVVPVMAVLTGIIGKKIRGAFRKNQEWVGRLTASIEESVSGIKVTKTFRREEAEFAKFEKMNDAKPAGRRGSGTDFLRIHAADEHHDLADAGADCRGRRLYGAQKQQRLAGGVSIGLLTAFILYSQRFFEPLRQITQVYSMIQSALAGAERLFEMMDMKPEVVEKPDALPLSDIRGAVEFNNVGFAYEEGKTVIEEINFKTRARTGGRHRRTYRRRQNHADQPAEPLL